MSDGLDIDISGIRDPDLKLVAALVKTKFEGQDEKFDELKKSFEKCGIADKNAHGELLHAIGKEAEAREAVEKKVDRHDIILVCIVGAVIAVWYVVGHDIIVRIMNG